MFDARRLLGRLLGYTETWWQNPGYGGLVIHPCWNVTNLHYFGPRTSENAAAVRAFLTLHRRFGRPEWLERSVECADLLVSLARPTGVFGNSTAEFDPEEGCLVHNALPDIALLELADYLDGAGGCPSRSGLYRDVVRRNIDWMIDYWWDGSYFCGTINQDLSAVVAMAMFDRSSGTRHHAHYIDSVISYVSGMVEGSGPAKGAIRRSREPGGRVLSSTYQAGKALLLLDLSEVYDDGRLLPLALGAARFVFGQHREDGLFDWGYVEEGGALRKKTYPLSASVGVARCGHRFEEHLETFDWMAYLGLILDEPPLRVTARGFGESSANDWRSMASSPNNVSILSFLAEITDGPPGTEAFDGFVISSGPDVLSGAGAYVLVESPLALFRITETPTPGLDLVLSKGAELPIVYPGMDREPTFAVFPGDLPGQSWERDGAGIRDGIITYRSGDLVREFRFGKEGVEVIQTPYRGGSIFFEASPRNSCINRFVIGANSETGGEHFLRLDGRPKTTIDSPGSWFVIGNGSQRLRNGDVRVSFSSPPRSVTVDHRAANPLGKLRASADVDPCDRLVVSVEPGHFPRPGYKHIN